MNDLFGDLPPLVSLPDPHQYGQHWDARQQSLRITMPQGELLYLPRFFSEAFSHQMLDYLLASREHDWRQTDWKTVDPASVRWSHIDWQQDRILLYGRRIPIPRFSAWYGDAGKSYTYSGLTLWPKAWNEGLLRIREAIEPIAGQTFNTVLLNWYRDGNDHMSWHADDEPELGRNPVIASVNFGATRRFLLRRRTHHAEKLELALHHGTLLVMRGEMQHHWQHAVPKASRVRQHRVNLTFRFVK